MNVLFVSKGILCPNCEKELKSFYFEEIMNMLELEKKYDDIYYSELYDSYEENVPEFVPKKNLENKQKRVTSKKKMPDVINPYKIYKEVTSNVIGQDEAIRNVLTTLVNNNSSDNAQEKSNIFLIGGTGTGKSETIKQIAKRLDIPYVIEDASKYTQEGYVGESVEGALAKLIAAADGDIQKAQRGIVIFDEIDKKTSNGENSSVATTSVQDSLLKMLEGANIKTSNGNINTEFITFVMIGACEAAIAAREKRLKGKGKIGFGKEKLTEEELEMKNPNILPIDMIEGGFKSEFIGRSDLIQEFKLMDIIMAINIINRSKISIFDLKLKHLQKYSVDIIMNREEVVLEIARRAVALKVGARGIRQVVFEMFKEIEANITISDIQSFKDYELYITKETVYNNTAFKLCKKEMHK